MSKLRVGKTGRCRSHRRPRARINNGTSSDYFQEAGYGEVNVEEGRMFISCAGTAKLPVLCSETRHVVDDSRRCLVAESRQAGWGTRRLPSCLTFADRGWWIVRLGRKENPLKYFSVQRAQPWLWDFGYLSISISVGDLHVNRGSSEYLQPGKSHLSKLRDMIGELCPTFTKKSLSVQRRRAKFLNTCIMP